MVILLKKVRARLYGEDGNVFKELISEGIEERI